MHDLNKSGRAARNSPVLPSPPRLQVAFGEARNFFHNKFIYLVISQRSRGLSIGVNLNPVCYCNFQCVYCEVPRDQPSGPHPVNVRILSTELQQMLELVQANRIKELPEYRTVPEELLQLREVAISGNGEPTLCPNFEEVVQELVHVRAQAQFPFFKLVLITNASGLQSAGVQAGLGWFTAEDEIWAKLDAGTPEYLRRINRTEVPLEQVLANLRFLGRQRPVIVQSLFALLHDQEPPEEEIQAYVARLAELKAAGVNIPLVQVYSAHRPTASPDCRHLSLKSLSHIAQEVRAGSGWPAEVF
jgi:wyosine [tRNA(Phe)-imidazoG37] synthetase (radical SAM superfamily)